MPRARKDSAKVDTLKRRHELAEKMEKGLLILPQGIAEMRLALNLTQVRFAKLFGITVRQLSEWENGKGNPSIDILRRLGRPWSFTVGYVPRPKDEPRRVPAPKRKNVDKNS